MTKQQLPDDVESYFRQVYDEMGFISDHLMDEYLSALGITDPKLCNQVHDIVECIENNIDRNTIL